MSSAINELGGDISDLPTIEYGRTLLTSWKNGEISEAFYLVGEISLKNVTEGFDITSDNTHGVRMYIALGPDEGFVPAQGDLICQHFGLNGSYSGWEITKVFFSEPDILVGDEGNALLYRGERNEYGDTSKGYISLGKAKMTSNSWGPVQFVMMFPNKHTPNFPNGYRIYRNMKIFHGDTSLKPDIIE